MHLEAMVRELMEQQSSATEQLGHRTVPTKLTTPPSLPHDPVDLDRADTSGDSRYVGFTHWSAILDDIQELKVALTEPNEAQDGTTSTSTPPGPALSGAGDDIIFGGSSRFSLQEILDQYLPPKVEVDRALAVYFRGETFVIPFVHRYQFQRQYREFWADTTKVNPLWLSMLLSICYMASLIGGTTAPTGASQDDLLRQRRRLHIAAARCLVLGSYRQLQPFALEALAIYGHCKNLGTLEPSRDAGTILAIVVRMAYEMGYHRDPDHLGHLTVFEAEMRRRFWAVCKQYDTMVSFQLGLPSSIVLENTDTKPPRHLLDSDFNESSTELPPSRSEEEPSPLLWFIVKDRMLALFSKVSRDALSFTERSEAGVVDLDREIRHVHAGIPEVLRSRALADSLTDSPFLIMTRFYIEFIHLKNLLVLHRKYMVKGSVFSTMACVEAGRSLVSQFIDMYREHGPGGQLYMERWMLNNFTMNDFLLGVMVLCLVVHLCRQRRLRKRSQDDGGGGGGSSSHHHQSFAIEVATQKEVLGLLEQSYAVCLEKAPVCRDAWRVSHAIRLTLDKATSKSNSEPKPRTTTTTTNTTTITTTTTSSSTSIEPQQQSHGVPIHDLNGRTGAGVGNTDTHTTPFVDFSDSLIDTNLNNPLFLGPEYSYGYAPTTYGTSNNNNNSNNDSTFGHISNNNNTAAETGLGFDSLNLIFNDLDMDDVNGWMSFDPQISDP